MTRSTADAQGSFDDLEPPLREITFVVVDLETTGGAAARDGITEIGAVKVRGGEVIGEFATLVNPQRAIPPSITLLTGITNAMVAEAPTIAQALPEFWLFAGDAALVAHNAPFDIGFLRAATVALGRPWPRPVVIDTVRLARAVFSRDEMPSVRLGVLAPALGARTSPNHRALADASATADVLHALIERLGPGGAATLSDLVASEKPVDSARLRKRHLAANIPDAPGVYLFRSGLGEVLYVGTSKSLRSRVRSYFTAAETRGRIKEMVRIAEKIDIVVCVSALEAQIREQRLITAHQPRYNVRSKNATRAHWIEMSSPPGATPVRLRSTAAAPSPGHDHYGPFSSRAIALLALGAARALGTQLPLIQGRTRPLLDALHERMDSQSAAGFYQQAAETRDMLATLAHTFGAIDRIRSLSAIEELIVANREPAGGWQIVVIRHGRLAAIDQVPRGTDPRPTIEQLRVFAETVIADPATGLAATAEETATLLQFLDQPTIRIVEASRGWSSGIDTAGYWSGFGERAARAREVMDLGERPFPLARF